MFLRLLSLAAAASALADFDTPTVVYRELSYAEIVTIMKEAESNCPDIVELYTAQKKYNLQSPGTCGSKPCEQFVVEITEKATMKNPSERPEVFFSGALHGDERVGPNAVAEAIKLLCNNWRSPNPDPWLKRMVQTRVIVLVPMTNALGYSRNTREEGPRDPNRDFPYARQPNQCMTTITARTVNEVYLDHIFQLAITFHGGMRAIAYEWGTNDHNKPKDTSPDHYAQKGLADAMAGWAGMGQGKYVAKNKLFFPADKLNRVVYAVNGGMEDWGYASSWQDKLTGSTTRTTCNPDTFDGYLASKTDYNDGVLRCFNILVESADRKHPKQGEYGKASGALIVDGEGNGDIPRNIRMLFFAVDLVEPYVVLADPVERTENDVQVDVLTWEVGGALNVDEAKLLRRNAQSGGKWMEVDLPTHVGPALDATPPTGANQEMGDDDLTSDMPERGKFVYKVPKTEPSEYRISVKVDQEWGTQPAAFWPPNIPIQSHLANARTNTAWLKSNTDSMGKEHVVRGRLWWDSNVVQSGGASGNSASHDARSTWGEHSKDARETFDYQGDLSPTARTVADGEDKEGTKRYYVLWLAAWGGFLVLVLCLQRCCCSKGQGDPEYGLLRRENEML